MRINKVAVACFKRDLHLLKPCVASIRYWYPDVEIYLIKDFSQGNFSTAEMESVFGVKTFPTDYKKFGWGWSKFALMLGKKKERFLFVDSDVVFLGPVLDILNTYEEDFVVTGMEEADKDHPVINRHFINTKGVEAFDPAYRYPGYGFNTGQIVLTSGVISPSDCSSVVELEPQFRSKHPDLFKNADQGILNYVLVKASQAGKASIRYADFWIWPGVPAAAEVSLQGIKDRVGSPYIMHWAGPKPVDFRRFSRYDILRFYENYYYAQIKQGRAKQCLSYAKRLLVAKAKILKFKLLRQEYIRN